MWSRFSHPERAATAEGVYPPGAFRRAGHGLDDVSRSCIGSALGLALLLAAGLPATAAPTASVAVALAPHAPISITGNANFTPANGVVGGTGTATDPYVIAGWSIDAPPSMGVQIRNTDAHAVVRDVAVQAAPTAGFYTFDVANLTFANITAYGSAGDGLRFESSQSIVVQRSNVTANNDGITLVGSVRISLIGNNVTLNRGDGVTVSQSDSILIQANTIAFAGLYGGYGVDLVSSTNVTVLANRFTGNDIYLDGTVAAHFTSHTITPDNLVSGLPILYLSQRTGLALSGIEIGELLVAGCSHLNVANLSTEGGDVGIEVGFSSDVQLGPNVTISNAVEGLRVVSSTRVQFIEGNILETGVGAILDHSTDLRVSGSKISSPFVITATPGDALQVLASDRVNISDNVMRHHLSGLGLYGASNVTVIGNVMSLDAAGFVAAGSRDLLVLDNLLAQDATGLQAEVLTNATFAGNGIEAAALGANVSDSSALRFMHNAFSNDALNALDTNGTSDAWDGGYPTGGNFWSNYSGVDQCSGSLQNVCTGPDGFGDTPYAFDVGATDHYPLMHAPALADVPPEALFYLSPAAGTPVTTFSASANLSSDYEDPLSALQFRWDWTGNGSWTPWSAAKYSSHRYLAPGTYTLQLEVRDTANLTDTWSTSVFVSPKPDNLPPAISIAAPSTVDSGQPITVVANITDASGVASAALEYFGVDGGSFVFVPMTRQVNGANFTATIPAQPHAGTLIFAVIANDTWENQARAPLGGYISVTVVDPLMSLLSTLAFPVAVVAIAAAAFLVWHWRRRGRAQQAPPPPLPPEKPPAERPPDNP